MYICIYVYVYMYICIYVYMYMQVFFGVEPQSELVFRYITNTGDLLSEIRSSISDV